MIQAENALLRAVRTNLRALFPTEKDVNALVEIEIDDTLVPSLIRDLYVAILPGRSSSGQRHQAEGTQDGVYSLSVVVMKRTTSVPRDRRRTSFLEESDSIADYCEQIIDAVDASYSLINTATADLPTGVSGSFIHPLLWAGCSPYETFAASDLAATVSSSGDTITGVKRRIEFTSARFMRVRT